MVRVFLLGSHMGYNLEHYMKIALERLGHSVKFFGYRDILRSSGSIVRIAVSRSSILRSVMKHTTLTKLNEMIKKEVVAAEPDLIISIKGESVLPDTVSWFSKELGIKTALWYPDDPRFFDSLAKHIAPCYDYVFTASKKMLAKYREIGVDEVHCLPFACEPLVHKKIEFSDIETKRVASDVCFIGTYYPRRGKIIESLNGLDISVYGPHWRTFTRKNNIHDATWGPDMVKVFNSSKIALNVHIESDLDFKANMKVFEIPACAAFMLTDKPYGLEELFTSGKEIVCYENEKELIELINYYLGAEEERTEISKKGQQRAYSHHSYEQRANTILKVAGL